MPKKAKIEKTATGKILKVVNPNAAGIDIASSEMQVCVPEDRDSECNRTFGCFTQDLKQIADWLKSCRIDTIAMESTESIGSHYILSSRSVGSMSFL